MERGYHHWLWWCQSNHSGMNIIKVLYKDDVSEGTWKYDEKIIYSYKNACFILYLNSPKIQLWPFTLTTVSVTHQVLCWRSTRTYKWKSDSMMARKTNFWEKRFINWLQRSLSMMWITSLNARLDGWDKQWLPGMTGSEATIWVSCIFIIFN